MKTDKLIDFKFFEYIVWHDGPLISLGITQDDDYVLEIWCDVNYQENYNIYAYAYLNSKNVESFLHSELSYYQTLLNCHEIITFKYNNEAYDFKHVDKKIFLQNYGPKPTADLSLDLVDFRNKFNYQLTSR